MSEEFDMNEAVGNIRCGVSRFEQDWETRLSLYKAYIDQNIFGEKNTNEVYAKYQAGVPEYCKNIPAGLSKRTYMESYLHSTQLMYDHEEWLRTSVQGGSGVTGTPGMAKTSIIRGVCEKLGIACVTMTCAGLTNSDLKGLPYLVESGGEKVGVEYAVDANLPVSIMSANLSNMSGKAFTCRYNMQTPPNIAKYCFGRYCFEGGIASEFGVLLIDEFLALDESGMGAMQQVISKGDHGIRRWSTGKYVLPPCWIVICAMNSRSEGGYAGEDELREMPEFIRQRLSMYGLYTVYADNGLRDWVRSQPSFGNVIPDFLDWAHGEHTNNEMAHLDDADLGLLQYAENGRITSVRLWEDAANQAAQKIKDKALMQSNRLMSENDIAEYDNAVKESARGAGYDKKSSLSFALAQVLGDASLAQVDPEQEKANAKGQEQLDAAMHILELRAEERARFNKGLSADEWDMILERVFHMNTVKSKFRIFFEVHQGVYGRFREAEGELLAYIKGESAKPPKLDAFDKLKGDRVTAAAFTARSYLRGLCGKARDELTAELEERLNSGITTIEDAREFMSLCSRLGTVVLRAMRWVNNKETFPVGVEDLLVPICQACNELESPNPGNKRVGAAMGVKPNYMSNIRGYIQQQGLKASGPLQKLEATLKGKEKEEVTNMLTLFRGGSMLSYLAIVPVTQKNLWKFPVKSDEQYQVLQNNQVLPIVLEDKLDVKYANMIMKQGSLDGNMVKSLVVDDASSKSKF